jgi:hypothetical protein
VVASPVQLYPCPYKKWWQLWDANEELRIIGFHLESSDTRTVQGNNIKEVGYRSKIDSRNMAEQASQHIVEPRAEVQNSQDEAQIRRIAPKYLALATVIPKWSGAETALPLIKFFDAKEGSTRIGNLTDADKIQVCALKPNETARVYYSAMTELKDPNITWAKFKDSFQKRFRMCVRTRLTSRNYKWPVRDVSRRRVNFLIAVEF